MATKNNLVDSVNKKISYLSKDDISSGIDLVFNYLKEQLTNQNRIEIRNFGSFSIRKRKKAGTTDNFYNTVYYRMAKSISQKINQN